MHGIPLFQYNSWSSDVDDDDDDVDGGDDSAIDKLINELEEKVFHNGDLLYCRAKHDFCQIFRIVFPIHLQWLE